MKSKALRRFACLCLCAVIPAASCAADDWYTVQELREMTRDGWHQTYETPWRTVRIDADIDVPDVEAFPVIRVERIPAVDVTRSGFEGLTVHVNNTGDFNAEYGDFPQSAASNAAFRYELSFGSGIPDLLPENNETIYQEALDTFDRVLRALSGRGIDALWIDSNRVISRYYKYQVVDGQKVWLDPLNDRGFYQISGQQLFHGIPLEYCGNYTTDGKNPRGRHGHHLGRRSGCLDHLFCPEG